MTTKSKIRKLEPIIKVREIQVDQEIMRLNEIRSAKLSIVTELKKYQKDYIEGVEQLNRERLSVDRLRVAALESAVDHSKANWYRCLKRAQEIENQEKAQLAQVTIAERNLKSTEKLHAKHSEQLRTEYSKKEQKTMDEIALRRLLNN